MTLEIMRKGSADGNTHEHAESNLRRDQNSILSVFSVLAMVLGSALCPLPAQAQDPWPLRPDGVPPVNIGTDDVMTLFEGHVFVARLSAPEPGREGGVKLRVYHYGENGRLYGCDFDPSGHYGTMKEPWIHGDMTFHDARLNLLVPVVAQVAAPDMMPTFRAVYHDPLAGPTIMFGRDLMGGWYPRETGHVQERLPAAVYTLCPDFPPADALGLEINAAQTARTYPELVAQHPGQRILRPDLIMHNPAEAAIQ